MVNNGDMFGNEDGSDKPLFNFTNYVMDHLEDATEAYMVEILNYSSNLARKTKRITVMPSDSLRQTSRSVSAVGTVTQRTPIKLG